jgi:uncharacterized protein (DUF983 family)
MNWEPGSAAPAPDPAPTTYPMPSLGTAVGRGLRNRCPVCGVGRVFNGYLTLVERCSHCHAPLGRLRADDAPPYFTILLVGHLLVPGVLWVEKTYQPPMWLHMVLWLPLFTLFCMALLRPVKGAVVGWMTTLGFGAEEDQGPATPAEPAKAAPVAAAPPRP